MERRGRDLHALEETAETTYAIAVWILNATSKAVCIKRVHLTALIREQTDRAMRSVDEWIGKNDDEPVPRRVRIRVFLRVDGQCAICSRRLHPGDKWTCDHRIALVNGGENREGNLQVLCEWCDKPKTVFDVQQKSKTARVRANHIGIKRERPSFLTNKDGPFRKKLTGEVVRR